MAKTLRERLEDLNTKIDKAENTQMYQHGDKQITRGVLFRLYEERDRVLTKIETHGSSYIEGQNTQPKKAVANVSFS